MFTRRQALKAGTVAVAATAAAACQPPTPAAPAATSRLITTLGPKTRAELGVILPHEHVFVDLRTWDKPGYAQADAQDVIALMGPELEKARAAGVTAIVESTPIGVGRRADILKAVSQAVSFPLVVPTGVYREPWIPPWVHEASEERLRDWMTGELTDEIRDGALDGPVSGVRAGWIKLSAGDSGLTETEAKVLRAAAAAGQATGAAIGSHTIRGRVVRDQLDIIEKAGYTPTRFIWIHAQAEPDFALHLELARRGVWIEYDDLGAAEWKDAAYLGWIKQLLDAGLGGQLLLSHDRGWYDPAQPAGGTPRPFTHLTASFIPRLQDTGLDQAIIRQLTQENPFRAFAR
jgi:phosphotriesterase-related protein